jgi:hypothetical protein
VLSALRGYLSPVPLRWSHHNYRDVRFGDGRTESVLGMLRDAAWSSDVAPLWLTEGGLNLGSSLEDPAQRDFQAQAIERSFRSAMDMPGLYLWTQHTISDKAGNDFKAGLRDDFTPATGLGPRRPSWFAWRSLPSASIP